MTFFGALGTAVSGVNAAATWVGNISDNIANSTTNGYKVVNTAFSDLVHNKVLGESPVIDSTKQGGVLASAKFENRAQGGYLQTFQSTNFAVSGQGFIPVGRPTSIVDTTTGGISDRTVTVDSATYFTRLGDFHMDAGNYLVNSNGYYLLASPLGSTTPQLLKVDDSPIEAIPTTTVSFTANLPSNATAGAQSRYAIPVYDPNSTATTGQHDLQVTWTKSATANEWQLQIDAGETGQTSFGPVTVTFADGTAPPFAAGRLQSLATADAGLTLTPSTDGGPATITLNPEFGGAAQPITLDLGTFNAGFSATATAGLTQYTTPGGLPTNVDFSQDGLPGAEFKNVSFNELGHIIYNYGNGRTQTLYQVTLANFREPDRLDRLDDTTFQPTTASGNVIYGNSDDPDNPAAVGRFVTATVEQSTVDIAEQMTFLVQAQQAYGMNSQVITAADQMLSRLIDLKR
ncbi:flagellar hook protein FlgE [Ferrovibrio sp.]|uniref:flagellar hook protein FlgE n=1 Tax=Ferrovibrio sp. TaxID=1917215 RepID=UPI003D1462EF